MDWTAEQKAELAQQYVRIGHKPGERWAAPPPELSPDELLALLRKIPDGAGHAGWLAALRGTA
jgi:hypothetical protein